jgi:hypothetical protein
LPVSRRTSNPICPAMESVSTVGFSSVGTAAHKGKDRVCQCWIDRTAELRF